MFFTCSSLPLLAQPAGVQWFTPGAAVPLSVSLQLGLLWEQRTVSRQISIINSWF